MKKTLRFVKTTALGGLVVIVPLAVLLIVLVQVVDVATEITAKAVELLPFPFLQHPVMLIALAVAATIALCFFTGLLVLTSTGTAIKNRIDAFLEEKVPLYGMLQSITKQFIGVDNAQLTPAEIDLYGSATRVLGFIVEQLPDGRYSVYVPDSPVLTVGQTYIVEESQLTRLEGSARATVDAITQWGAGTRFIYRARRPDEASTPANQPSKTGN